MTQLCFHFADLDTQAQKTVNLLFTITSEEMQSWVCEASEECVLGPRAPNLQDGIDGNRIALVGLCREQNLAYNNC